MFKLIVLVIGVMLLMGYFPGYVPIMGIVLIVGAIVA